MSKKGKKFDATTEASTTEASTTEATSNVPAAEGDQVQTIAKPKAPTLYLTNDSSGLHYKLDRRNHLPKKAAVAGSILINGIHVPFQVTSNKGWAVSEDKVIDYLWLTLPEGVLGAGEKTFMTLDYTVPGASMDGATFSIEEGTPNRFPMKADGTGYAQRLGKIETEEARKKAFSESMAKKKAATAATPAAEAPAEVPAEA